MRRVGLVAALLVAMGGAAQAFETPGALVEAIYEPYRNGQAQEAAQLQQFYSARLKALYDGAAERDGVGQVENGGAVSVAEPFNPFLPDQGVHLFDLAISTPELLKERALVSVRFSNFGQPNLLSLSLLREADGWKVDDVASMGEGEHWLLSWLLAFDPFEN